MEHDDDSLNSTIWGGTATFVPIFGREGVIIMLGGKEFFDALHTPPGLDSETLGETDGLYRDWEMMSIYDVASGK